MRAGKYATHKSSLRITKVRIDRHARITQFFVASSNDPGHTTDTELGETRHYEFVRNIQIDYTDKSVFGSIPSCRRKVRARDSKQSCSLQIDTDYKSLGSKLRNKININDISRRPAPVLKQTWTTSASHHYNILYVCTMMSRLVFWLCGNVTSKSAVRTLNWDRQRTSKKKKKIKLFVRLWKPRTFVEQSRNRFFFMLRSTGHTSCDSRFVPAKETREKK